MSRFLFYPGCSLQRSARPYLESLETIRKDLDMDIEEIKDWNCCGATEYSSVYSIPAHALVGRNLALAQEQVNGTRTLMAACSACYLNLAKTNHLMREDERLRTNVNDALGMGGLHYEPDTVEVRHLLDVIFNEVGLEAIKALVVRPLKGLRVAPYYGCMIVRPDLDHRFDNPEYPMALDQLLQVLGAEVIDFPLKTHCCSGHMTQISPDVAYALIQRLVHGADQYRADIMVTLCPMCQLNLDAYQGEMNQFFNTSYHMPVLYFTQLMGLAFGYEPPDLGIGREFVLAREALAKIGVELPEPEEEKPRRKIRKKDDPSLPMPIMPGKEEVV